MIRGFGAGSDGRSKGLTAPRPESMDSTKPAQPQSGAFTAQAPAAPLAPAASLDRLVATEVGKQLEAMQVFLARIAADAATQAVLAAVQQQTGTLAPNVSEPASLSAAA